MLGGKKFTEMRSDPDSGNILEKWENGEGRCCAKNAKSIIFAFAKSVDPDTLAVWE
jgi:hypothetical protein